MIKKNCDCDEWDDGTFLYLSIDYRIARHGGGAVVIFCFFGLTRFLIAP